MIELDEVSKRLGGEPVLKGLCLSLKRGKVLGLVGRSGTGKSTLLRCINLLVRPDCGAVRIDGTNLVGAPAAAVRRIRQRIGFVFQSPRLLTHETVVNNVILPLRLCPHRSADKLERGRAALARVGLLDLAERYPTQLSGGQQQRVGIARALIGAPDILLCDEMTAALDAHTAAAILQHVKNDAATRGTTVIMASHDIAALRTFCDELAVLHAGQIVQRGPASKVDHPPNHGAMAAPLAAEAALSC